VKKLTAFDGEDCTREIATGVREFSQISKPLRGRMLRHKDRRPLAELCPQHAVQAVGTSSADFAMKRLKMAQTVSQGSDGCYCDSLFAAGQWLGYERGSHLGQAPMQLQPAEWGCWCTCFIAVRLTIRRVTERARLTNV
jgi:hypothetical protein